MSPSLDDAMEQISPALVSLLSRATLVCLQLVESSVLPPRNVLRRPFPHRLRTAWKDWRTGRGTRVFVAANAPIGHSDSGLPAQRSALFPSERLLALGSSHPEAWRSRANWA